MPQDATSLIPQWTADDFDSEKPYEWLYGRRNGNKFLFQQLLNKTMKAANAVGVNTIVFKQYWKAYVEAMEPKTTILGANTTAFPGQEKVLQGVDELQCGMYQCDENGVCYTGRMGEDIQVISHPILPVKRIINIDSGDERLQIAYKRGTGRQWQTLITKADTVASAQKIIGLSNNGIAVNSENAKEVVRFLSDIVSRNFDEIPLQKSTAHLGWLEDGRFVPYAKDIEYDGENSENLRMFNAFREEGSYDEWLKIAKEARAGKSIPCRIALAGAFAAPLVSKFKALPFILHFYGETSKGKSVGLMLSASVWAEPSVGGAYIHPFNATKNAQETVASFCCNVPVYIDELQMIADRKTFDDIIYMLCEGSSKPRATKDGGLQTKKNWLTCILTTGEFPIIKSNSGGGAVGRTIEVDYGGVPFFDDARTVANLLKENYGFAGRRFIEELQKPDTWEAAKAVQESIYKQLSQADVQSKQMLSASILLTADRLAEAAIFHDGKYLTVEDIKPYLVTNQQADANFRCYQWLNGFIATNPKRFETEDNNGEVWGVRDDGVVYIIRTVFEKVLAEAGYSSTTFLNWAKQHNKIRFENYGTKSGNNRLTKRKQINGHPTTCIAFVPDETDGFVEVDDAEMPF